MEVVISEALRGSFYKVIQSIMQKYSRASDTYIQKELCDFTSYLLDIRTLPFIMNQVKLSLEKYKEESGLDTSHIFKEYYTLVS